MTDRAKATVTPGEDEALLRAFSALLELEQQALVHGDVTCIEGIVREKAAYASRLSSAGWTSERAGQAATLVRKVRALNEENGRLVAWRLGRLAERLAALGALGAEGTTYDAGGHARSRAVTPRPAKASGSPGASSAPRRPASA